MEKSLIIYHSSRIDTYGNTANENWESCDLSDNISKHSMVKVEAGNFENICATRIWICKNEYEFLMLYFEVVYQALNSAWQWNSKIIKCTTKKNQAWSNPLPFQPFSSQVKWLRNHPYISPSPYQNFLNWSLTWNWFYCRNSTSYLIYNLK